MGNEAVTIQALINAINAKHATTFTVQQKFALGENGGAYVLRDAHGVGYVLKWNNRPAWQRSLRRAQHVTDHLAVRGVPVPRYVLFDTSSEDLLYWIQTALPGTPPEKLSLSHTQQLVDLVEKQAGQSLATGSDWSAYVRVVVFAGHSGWQDSLARYNSETRSVLARLAQCVTGKADTTLRAGDICHGDFNPSNVLVAGQRVTGIVDWDAAGEGDRALDLAKLLFYSYHTDDIRAQLRTQIIAISGADAYVIYQAYNILAQLDWSIQHHGPDCVANDVTLAHQILADVEKIAQ